MTEIQEKTCTLCKIVKPLNDFYLIYTPIGSATYRSECKKCKNKRDIRNHQKKRKKRKNGAGNPNYQAYQRKYYAENPERFKRYRAEWRARYPTYFTDLARRKKAAQTSAREALRDADTV